MCEALNELQIRLRRDAFFLTELLEEGEGRRLAEAMVELLGRYRAMAVGEYNNKAAFLKEAVKVAREHNLSCAATVVLLFAAGIAYVSFTPALAVELLLLGLQEGGEQ